MRRCVSVAENRNVTLAAGMPPVPPSHRAIEVPYSGPARVEERVRLGLHTYDVTWNYETHGPCSQGIAVGILCAYVYV